MWALIAQSVPTPTFSDLATFYGAASVPLAMSFVAIVYLVRERKQIIAAKDKTIEAMATEMRSALTEQSAVTGDFVEVTTRIADTVTDANSYLKELRDQGIRSTARWERPT